MNVFMFYLEGWFPLNLVGLFSSFIAFIVSEHYNSCPTPFPMTVNTGNGWFQMIFTNGNITGSLSVNCL